MPNVRAADKVAIVIYADQSIVKAIRAVSKAKGLKTTELQTEYLDLACRRSGRTPRRTQKPKEA